MQSLDPKAWLTIASKFKIKDNGLQKALTTYDKLEDDAHDECLKTIASVSQLAKTLKTSKEVAAAPEAAKYLTNVLSAAEAEKNEVLKAKVAAGKAQAAADKAKEMADKAQAAADKAKAAVDKGQEDENEDEEEAGDYKAKLLSAFQKVKNAKDQVYQFIVCDTKPHPGLMIAKKISASHKDELTKVTGGGKKFLKPGTVAFESGHYVFTMDQPVSGLARKLQDSIKNFTGKKLPITVGTESAEEDEQPAGAQAPGAQAAGAAAGAAAGVGAAPATAPQQPATAPGAPRAAASPATTGTAAGTGAFSISASVGKGGKNKPQDVQAVQVALNAKAKAGLVVDGKCGPKTIGAILAYQKTLGRFKPDGLVEVGRGTARALAGAAPPGPPPEPPKPVPPPTLGKGTLDSAPNVWHSTRGILEKNIGELKKAVRSEYASEHPTLLKDIEQNLKKLDGILEKLDTKLAESLTEANAAKDPAARKAKLQQCKAMVAQHIMYVKSEPLIAHIDNNPFGVDTNCKRVLTDCLLHVAQAIGT